MSCGLVVCSDGISGTERKERYMMQGSLSTKLRVLRAREGLTLIEAAEKLGVGRDTLSSIERGHQHPTFPTLKRLAEGYGVDVEELLEEPEDALALAGEAETPDQGPASPGRTSRTKVPEIRVPRVGTRRAKASRNRTPELLLEQLHEHGIQTNLSEVSILSQIIGISDELVEEEPLEWEQIGWLLAYTLAHDMLTQDEIEAARAALRRKVVESA